MSALTPGKRKMSANRRPIQGPSTIRPSSKVSLINKNNNGQYDEYNCLEDVHSLPMLEAGTIVVIVFKRILLI